MPEPRKIGLRRVAVFQHLAIDAGNGGEDRRAGLFDEKGPDRRVARPGVERPRSAAGERIEDADAKRVSPVDVAGVEQDVVLAQPKPVRRHRPAPENRAVGVQDAFRLGRRAGGEDEIRGIVRPGRGIIDRLTMGGEPPGLLAIEDPKMSEKRALLRISVAEENRRGAQILRQRQRLRRGQEEGGRLGDAADRRRREEGEREIDVVRRADHDPVALGESAGDEPAREPARHQIQFAVAPRTESVRPVGEDQRGLFGTERRLSPKAMPCEVERVRRGRIHGGSSSARGRRTVSACRRRRPTMTPICPFGDRRFKISRIPLCYYDSIPGRATSESDLALAFGRGFENCVLADPPFEYLHKPLGNSACLRPMRRLRFSNGLGSATRIRRPGGASRPCKRGTDLLANANGHGAAGRKRVSKHCTARG